MAKKKPVATERSKAVSKAKPTARSAKAAKPIASGTIYQLKITLEGIRPPIWRRVQTKDCSLAKLHDLIQVGMGWFDGHLHVFQIGGDEYGDPVQWPKDGMFDEEKLDEHKLKLSEIVGWGLKKFRYEYDMGDSWLHAILMEKVVAPDAGAKYPRCIAGARACPPEDCGGPWGYGDLLDALEKPQGPRHQEILEWLGGDFDPEAFDVEEINRTLQKR